MIDKNKPATCGEVLFYTTKIVQFATDMEYEYLDSLKELCDELDAHIMDKQAEDTKYPHLNIQ